MMNQNQPSEHKPSQKDFMRLFLKNEPILRSFARSLLPNWQSVDDVIQESSITLWEKLSQLNDEEGFLPWAKVVVRYKCLSSIRYLRRNQVVFSDAVLELIAEEAESPEFDEQIISTKETLRVCLKSFQPHHQELLLGAHTGHGEIKNIAKKTGKTPNALYKLLARLRSKLSNCVQETIQGAHS